MEIQKPNIILYGPTIILDNELIKAFDNWFHVILCNYSKEVTQIIDDNHIRLMLFEFAGNYHDLELLGKLVHNFPALKIVGIGSAKSMNIIAKAFHIGIEDFFKKPFLINLIVERVRAFHIKISQEN